jgi:hypothetical protein
MNDLDKLRPGENLFNWLLLFFSLFVLVMAYRIAGFSSVDSAGAFPLGAATIMVLAILTVLIGDRDRERVDSTNLLDELRQAARRIFPPRILVYIGLIGAYAFCIERLHFLPATTLFLLISIIYLKGTTVLRSLFVTVGTVACIYAVFLYVFKVVVP